jgi:hypothetical protein
MSRDDGLPNATTIPCVIPTSQNIIEGDAEIMPSIESGMLDGQVSGCNRIDTISPRPAARKSTIRHDTFPERVGSQYQQEQSLQKIEQERLHDKEKIRHLEEEIKKLKEVGVMLVDTS